MKYDRKNSLKSVISSFNEPEKMYPINALYNCDELLISKRTCLIDHEISCLQGKFD